MDWLQENGDSFIISVRVVPRASRDSIAGIIGGEALKIRIQAPPVEGKANAYLVKYLAKQWKIQRNSIEILTGETGRNKRIRIHRPSEELRRELLSIGPC